ncbi:class I SAM-dependent methyltransferase [Candidatus Poriferisocius sp.]|uniref:class I SAM-dependent methyltransferase n=1 Tax=Candidatus Poriferisocius sp. TaxID=3101276 RepID=UPI003B020BFE
MADDGYGVREGEVEIERRRLALLAEARDSRSRRILDSTGLSPGWRCWELGAGSGSLSAWLGRRVGPGGTVWSTDTDLRFHREVLPNVVVEQHNVVHDPVPTGAFDLVHARAVLQHLPERDRVMETLWAALVPGGWLVVEDGNFMAFGEQALPEPYATVHRYVSSGTLNEWRDPDYGMRLPGRFRDLGATDIDIIGDVWAMRPGEPGGEWWFLALDRAIPRLVDAGLVTAEDGEKALAQVRMPGFVMMSTVSIAVFGRKPPDPHI